VAEINNYYDSGTESFDCMILFDMVGGINLRFINEQYSTSSLLDELFAVGRALGYSSQFPSNPERNQIIDDHRAFVNIGIPAADLIINFWDNPGWSYNHTTQDNITYISDNNLEITGRTVEQFIYNIYLNSSSYIYEGNYRWNEDIDILYVEIIMIFLISISIMAIAILILLFIRYSPSKNMID
jgi:hypothetical protein